MSKLSMKLLTLSMALSFFMVHANDLINSEQTIYTGIAQDSISEKEVSEAVKSINNGLINPNRELLERLTFENITYGHSSGNIQNQSQFIDELLSGPFVFLEINTSGEQIQIVGETAIARHIMTAKARNNEGPVDVHIGIMMVFRKQNGKLKLLARQAYKI